MFESLMHMEQETNNEHATLEKSLSAEMHH